MKYIKNEERYLALKKELGNIRNLLYPSRATQKFTEYIGKYLDLETN